MNERYVLEGKTPVQCPDLMTWAEWFGKADRHVAETKVGDVRVSTVFLGLDHSFGRGAPKLFETMVFGGVLDGDQERYATWDEAAAGHEDTVRAVRKARG